MKKIIFLLLGIMFLTTSCEMDQWMLNSSDYPNKSHEDDNYDMQLYWDDLDPDTWYDDLEYD